jgi:uncharacterized membrane protein
LRLGRSFSRFRRGLWFIPLVCVLAGVALSFGTIELDQAYDYRLVPRSISGGPDAALQILSTVAASMVSLAALVLTITRVVVQLAMGQFSPRIVQRILQDKPSQFAIGVFVATFAHSILALREVQTDGGEVVPGLAVAVAFVLVLVSIMVLVWYVNHIGRALRVSALIELVGHDTRKLLDKHYAGVGGTSERDGTIIATPRSGVITQIDHEALVGLAKASDCVLTLRPALGEFVPAGATLFEISGSAERLDPRAAIASSSSASSAPSTGTWPTVCAFWSILPSGLCLTEPFSIRPPPCRPSTGCMIACASLRRGAFQTADTGMTTVTRAL